jgi:hypothetical protein
MKSLRWRLSDEKIARRCTPIEPVRGVRAGASNEQVACPTLAARLAWVPPLNVETFEACARCRVFALFRADTPYRALTQP